jgi:hypothetical protein
MRPRQLKTPRRTTESAADEAVISFYPDGTADAGDIVLRDREGFRLRCKSIRSRRAFMSSKWSANEFYESQRRILARRSHGCDCDFGHRADGLTQGITTALGSSKESELQTTGALFAAGQIELLRAEKDLTDGTTEAIAARACRSIAGSKRSVPRTLPGCTTWMWWSKTHKRARKFTSWKLCCSSRRKMLPANRRTQSRKLKHHERAIFSTQFRLHAD